MAFRNLTIDEMLGLTSAWLDPARGRAHLERVPLLASLLPTLDAAHQGLLELLRPRHLSPLAESLVDLSREAAVADVLHDRKGRGAFAMLTALVELTDDPVMVGVYQDLQKRLFPDGISIVDQAYLAEAGNAERLARELADPSVRAVLESIVRPGGRTLLSDLEALVFAGSELGRLEARRAALIAQSGAPESQPQPRGAVLKARKAWVDAVETLQANLSLASGVDEAIEAHVLRPLREAEGAADRRGTR